MTNRKTTRATSVEWENAHAERLTAGLLDEDDEIDDYAAIIEDGGDCSPREVERRAFYPDAVGRSEARGGRGVVWGGEHRDRNEVHRGGGGRARGPTTMNPRVERRDERLFSRATGGSAVKRGRRKVTSVLTTAAEAPVVTLIRCTMPDLGSDPARRSDCSRRSRR